MITEIFWRIFWRDNWRSLIVVVENFRLNASKCNRFFVAKKMAKTGKILKKIIVIYCESKYKTLYLHIRFKFFEKYLEMSFRPLWALFIGWSTRDCCNWEHGLSAAIKLGNLEKTVIASLFHSGLHSGTIYLWKKQCHMWF